MNTATNYHETLKADFFERFYFIDDLRAETDEWERKNIKRIILQGVDAKEFVLNIDINIISEMTIMVLKGLEIPFFLQGQYNNYSHHPENLIGILSKGLSK